MTTQENTMAINYTHRTAAHPLRQLGPSACHVAILTQRRSSSVRRDSSSGRKCWAISAARAVRSSGVMGCFSFGLRMEIVVLVSGKDVDGAQEGRPSLKAAQIHVGGYHTRGGAVGYTADPLASNQEKPPHVISLPFAAREVSK